MFYQGGLIDHCTHAPCNVDQSSAYSKYNASCTAGTDVAHFGVLNNDFLNKDTDVVPEQEPLVILDSK